MRVDSGSLGALTCHQLPSRILTTTETVVIRHATLPSIKLVEVACSRQGLTQTCDREVYS